MVPSSANTNKKEEYRRKMGKSIIIFLQTSNKAWAHLATTPTLVTHVAMLTRSRSSSIDTAEDSENACSSQSTPVVSRQLSSTSSYFDSQDSVAIDEVSSKSKTKRKINKTKPLQALPDCNQRVMILPG